MVLLDDVHHRLRETIQPAHVLTFADVSRDGYLGQVGAEMIMGVADVDLVLDEVLRTSVLPMSW